MFFFCNRHVFHETIGWCYITHLANSVIFVFETEIVISIFVTFIEVTLHLAEGFDWM